ncbi:hypothetical protein [Streptomyces gobiensis]|uniref:hypothetical protein n=1 Tax=Streptomyces gobiensis TaxID=2875706 RepID=UPI001E3A6D23|nr:hypothetical protein [Streptomyces gobiensis]UGY90783.1 hypothetical protein test1122_02955 [Streptomyces gobiensis]
MTTRSERRRRADIVRYWQAVEMFSPQKVENVAPERRVYAVDGDRPLPWESRHRLRREEPGQGKVWQHTVYCGIHSIAAVRDVLLDVFGGSSEDHDRRIDGDSALLSFTVNDDGLLLQDSIVFSSCGWAVGRARKPGPDAKGWLDGFEEEAETCERLVLDLGDGKLKLVNRLGDGPGGFAGLLGEVVISAAGAGIAPGLAPLIGEVAADIASAAAEPVLDRLAPAEETDEEAEEEGAQEGDPSADEPPKLGSKPITVRDLAAVTRWLSERYGVTADLRPFTVRVKSYAVRADRADEADGSDFLNSR